jgi:hypothetical protein
MAPSLARADVDCHVVDRIERINRTIGYLRSDPVSERAPYNQIILISDLAALSARAASHALKDHSSQTDITDLVILISMAQETTKDIHEKSIFEFAISLRTDQWTTTVRNATIALSHMPCGDIQGRLAGDAEGREIDNVKVDKDTFVVKERVIEKPVRTAILSILAIATTAIATHQATLWLRNRALLSRRRSKRFATQIASHLAVDGGVYEAEVLDLSCRGAKVRYWHTEAIKPDARVGIRLDDEWRMGTLAWVNKLFIGIRFEKRLRIPLVRKLAEAPLIDGLGRLKPKK